MNIRFPSPFWRSILFLLPLLFVFGPPLLVLWLGGEFISPDGALRRQSRPGSSVLYGAAYTDRTPYVKYHAVLQRRPRILVLGNSRVLEFGTEFFRPGAGFYNGGSAVVRIKHFRAFIEALPPEASPKILILGLHQPFFNAAFDAVDETGNNGAGWFQSQIQDRWQAKDVFTANWPFVYGDLLHGKILLGRLLTLRGLHDRVGLVAAMRGQGFRTDGSFLYPPSEPTDPPEWDHDFQVTFSNIDAGRSHYVYGQVVSEPALREFESLLLECRHRGIHVIGYLPPFAHAVWAKMMSMGEKYGYLAGLERALRPRLEKAGGEFYDFSDLANLGADDTEAVDGHHCSDKAHLRIVLAMVKSRSWLAEFVDAPALEALLAANPGNSRIFRASP